MSKTTAMLMLYLLRASRVSSFAKTEGTTKHMAAIERWMTVGPVILGLSFSSPNFILPVNILNPRIRSILPMIDPINEYFTMSTNPLLMAMIAMTSSAALPKVALIIPEKWSPVFSESTSVASPKKWANGTRTAEAKIKVITAGKWQLWAIVVTGMSSSR